jgi:hypothetical protein
VIYGVDPGVAKLAVVCPETCETFELKLKTTTPRRHLLMHEWLLERVPGGGHLWIETPIQGASGDVLTCIRIAETVGTVLATYLGDVDEVNLTTWKKAVIGHGHADKDAINVWLAEHHPALAEACQGSQDLRDAACVGLYGAMRARGEVEAPRKLPRRRRPRAVLRPTGQQGPDAQAAGR